MIKSSLLVYASNIFNNYTCLRHQTFLLGMINRYMIDSFYFVYTLNFSEM